MSIDIDKLLADSSEETVSEVKETVSEETVKETVKETAGEAPGEAVEESSATSRKEVATTEKKAPKKKGKPRGGNSPVIGNNGLMVEPGDNARFLSVNMALFNMPDIDMNDVEAVQARLDEYFTLYTSNDMKPTVAGMAIALNGMHRRTLWAITHDQATGSSGYTTALPPEVAHTIKKAYFLLENLWESYMNSGKVNPVSGIFLGKNNFGYQDKTEYVLTPNAGQDETYSADDIRDRYIQADQQKRLSAANSDTDENPSD